MLRRLRLLAPQRHSVRPLAHDSIGIVERKLLPARMRRAADIAQDCEQPGLYGGTAEAVEIAVGAEIGFLRGVLGIGIVAEQVARKRINGVEMRKGECPEAPGLFAIVMTRFVACHRYTGPPQ